MTGIIVRRRRAASASLLTIAKHKSSLRQQTAANAS
jgi:hypothetical protein